MLLAIPVARFADSATRIEAATIQPVLTEAMIVKALATAGAGGAKAIVAAKGKALGTELLARFDNDASFQAAVAEDRERILWTLHAIAIAIARAAFGTELDGDQATKALLEMATEPATVRSFRALLNEASTSTDERVAMLATGYFVHAERPSLRNRLDWALRGLFPVDADALGAVIELSRTLTGTQGMLALELHSMADEHWVLVPSDGATPLRMTGHAIAQESLRALSSAQCIELGGQLGRALVHVRPPGSNVGRMIAIGILPLGLELHRILGSIDWREIARRRAVLG